MKPHHFEFCRAINKSFDLDRPVLFGPVSLYQDFDAKIDYWGCYVSWVKLNGDFKFGFLALSTDKAEALRDYPILITQLRSEWPNIRYWISVDDFCRLQPSDRWSNPQLVEFEKVAGNRTEKTELDLFQAAPVKKGLFAT